MPLAETVRSKPGALETSRLRRRYATFFDKRKASGKASGRPRFPMWDESHARNALARLPEAKGLSDEEKQVVAQRAANILGEVTDGARSFGVTRITKPRRDALLRRPTILAPRRSKRRSRARFRKS